MTIATPTPATETLTYEQYLEEGEVFKRYDIVDGERIFMTNPTRRHQDVLFKIAKLLDRYGEASRRGKVIIAPCDILIRRSPLRTRQPDVLFLSNELLERCGDPSDPAPLEVAPELVVEILSPTETRRVHAAKIADYRAIGVSECWVVSPRGETVEVLRLTPERAETVAVYAAGQTAQSVVFSDLAVDVAEIFTV